MKLYQKIAQHVAHGMTLQANPGKYPAGELLYDQDEQQIKNILPSGSGFDSGIKIDYDNSKPDRIVLNADFHHMDDNGYYDGWTEHNIVITPSLINGFNIRVTGINKRGIKEYISDFAYSFLNEEF